MTTRVKFVQVDGGDMMALFPDIPADFQGNILSYMRVGQHGAAAPSWLMEPGMFDYALHEELKGIYPDLEMIDMPQWVIDVIMPST